MDVEVVLLFVDWSVRCIALEGIRGFRVFGDFAVSVTLSCSDVVPAECC